MLESIKNEILNAKSRIEQNKANAINEQIGIARQKFVDPKYQELEIKRNSQLSSAQKSYQDEVSAINLSIDTQKKDFDAQVVNQISDSVGQSYDDAIEQLNKIIGE